MEDMTQVMACSLTRSLSRLASRHIASHVLVAITPLTSNTSHEASHVLRLAITPLVWRYSTIGCEYKALSCIRLRIQGLVDRLRIQGLVFIIVWSRDLESNGMEGDKAQRQQRMTPRCHTRKTRNTA